MKISYDGHVVKVSERGVKPEKFAERFYVADKILSYFPAKQRNMWGTDGVGYEINKSHGLIERSLSVVGPRKFAEVIKTVLQHFPTLEMDKGD